MMQQLISGFAVVLAIVAVGIEAETTLVNRRILEGQAGWKDVIQHVKSYEIHDFSNHESTRRVLSIAGQESLNYDLHVLGRRMTLELKRHDSLFARGYQHHYVDEKGNILKSEDKPNCIYTGSVAGEKSIATVSLCEGLVHATVYHDDEDKSFSIQPLDALQKESREHVVYRLRDLIESNRQCGVGRDQTDDIVPTNDGRLRRLWAGLTREHDHGEDHHHHHEHNHMHTPRDNKMELANGASATVTTRRSLDSATKYIGVSVVNDKKRYDAKQGVVHQHSSYLFGIANSLYAKVGVDISSPFQYQLEIVSMYTFVEEDPWTYSPVPSYPPTNNPTNTVVRVLNGEAICEDMLAAFNHWRSGNVEPAQDTTHTTGADIAHLLTGYTFAGSTIGLAHVSGVCNLNQRSGETQAAEITDTHQASTITHEIGHNLGAQHTDTPPSGFSSCQNNNGEQIMAAGSSYGFTNWEACTIEYFRRLFQSTEYTLGVSGYSKCAEVPSSVTFDGTPVCGDGLVQGDEKCDCLNNNCNGEDDCCDAATCQLVSGAECALKDGCCGNDCKVKNDTSIVCRPASSSCDLAETCDGVSGRCPFDTFKETGTSCLTEPDSFSGTCYSKKCFDMGQECTTRGLSNPTASAWDRPCSNSDETSTASPSSNDCVISCKKGASGSCESYQTRTFYADGTQCDTGKACYQGTCMLFASVPVAINPNCSNGALDNNETDIDCGGNVCFGCAANKFCLSDADCLFPSNCNKTTTFDANGYTGLGKCSASAKNALDDLLNMILDWFRHNPYIWGPILGVIVLLLLGCCLSPRGDKPPVAKAVYLQGQNSFRNMRGNPSSPPVATAVAVPVQGLS